MGMNVFYKSDQARFVLPRGVMTKIQCRCRCRQQKPQATPISKLGRDKLQCMMCKMWTYVSLQVVPSIRCLGLNRTCDIEQRYWILYAVTSDSPCNPHEQHIARAMQTLHLRSFYICKHHLYISLCRYFHVGLSLIASSMISIQM